MKKKHGLLLFLMSIVLGGFLGMFVGMFKARAESNGIIFRCKTLDTMAISYQLTTSRHYSFFDFQFPKEKQKISFLVSRGNG